MEAANDYSLLFAICTELKFEIPRRNFTEIQSDLDCEALGVLSSVTKEAVADNRISENERRSIIDAMENAQKELEKIRYLVINIK
jgi:hypothetical protein